jgi:uncharacterized protein
LLTNEYIDYLCGNGITLQISLDGPKHIHDRYRVFRGGRGSFERVMSNIRKIEKRHPDYFQENVSFVAVLTPPYEFSAINEFFASEFPDLSSLRVTYLSDMDTLFFDKYLDGDRDRNNFRKQYQEAREHYIRHRIQDRSPTVFERGLFEADLIKIHKRPINRLEDTINANGNCIPGIRRCFVDVYGNMYPCERGGRAFCMGTVIDGLKTEAICDIVEKYVEYSEVDCVRCWAMRLCSICFATSQRGNKFSRTTKRETCCMELNKIHAGLVTYCTILEENPNALDFIKHVSTV